LQPPHLFLQGVSSKAFRRPTLMSHLAGAPVGRRWRVHDRIFNRPLRSFVLATCFASTHARLATRTPYATLSSSPTECASESITSGTPSSIALLVHTSSRSNRFGSPSISSIFPLSFAVLITLARSIGFASRLPISLFVGWQRKSTSGCESALIALSVSFSASCLKFWCSDAPTRSNSPRNFLSKSREPSLLISSSTAFSTRNGASSSLIFSISFHCLLNLPSERPLATLTETEWSVTAMYW